MPSKNRLTRKFRKVGGFRFTETNLESPEENSIERAPWSLSANEQYVNNSNISTTNFGDLVHVNGMTKSSIDALKAAGINTEFDLCFYSVGFYRQPSALAIVLKQIGVKYPVHIARLIYSKVSRLWYVPFNYAMFDSETEYPDPSIDIPLEIPEFTKNAIMKYIYENIAIEQLKMFEILEITPYDLETYITEMYGKKDLEDNFLSYLSPENLKYFNQRVFLERIYRTYAVEELISPETSLEFVNYVRLVHGGEEGLVDFYIRLKIKDKTKATRFIQKVAWERRRHAIPGWHAVYYGSNAG